MIGAGSGQAGTLQPQNNGGISRPQGVGNYNYGGAMNFSVNPKSEKLQGEIFNYMKKKDGNQLALTKQSMKWNGGLQAGHMAAETLTKSMDSIFTHVANMKQLSNYETYLNNQHDIARRSINLELEKLKVTKEMQNNQLKYQIKVAQYQKETSVTVAAIQQKGKTKRVQALAALRTVYGRGKPVSPFQRSMT